MRQEAVLAMLAKEPSHGYELRARLRHTLGPLGEAPQPGAGLCHVDSAGEGAAGGVRPGGWAG